MKFRERYLSARGWIDLFFFFSSRRRHTRCSRDWSSDVCSSDLLEDTFPRLLHAHPHVQIRILPRCQSCQNRLHKRCQIIRVTNPRRPQPLSRKHYRSEERRVGKEWKFLRWPYLYRKTHGFLSLG